MSVARFLGGSPGSTSTRRAAGVLAVADTVGIGVAVTLIAATVIRGQSLGGVDDLLILGIPLLAAGQLWTILLAKARKTRRSGLYYPDAGSLRVMLGPVDRWVTRTLTSLIVIGWLSGMSSFLFLFQGSPAGPGGGCSYRLVNHDVYTCVSKLDYDLAGAAGQRLVAGVFLFFFAIHLYAALASRNQNGEYVPT